MPGRLCLGFATNPRLDCCGSVSSFAVGRVFWKKCVVDGPPLSHVLRSASPPSPKLLQINISLEMGWQGRAGETGLYCQARLGRLQAALGGKTPWPWGWERDGTSLPPSLLCLQSLSSTF